MDVARGRGRAVCQTPSHALDERSSLGNGSPVRPASRGPGSTPTPSSQVGAIRRSRPPSAYGDSARGPRTRPALWDPPCAGQATRRRIASHARRLEPPGGARGRPAAFCAQGRARTGREAQGREARVAGVAGLEPARPVGGSSIWTREPLRLRATATSAAPRRTMTWRLTRLDRQGVAGRNSRWGVGYVLGQGPVCCTVNCSPDTSLRVAA